MEYIFYIGVPVLLGFGIVFYVISKIRNTADYNRSLDMVFLELAVPISDSKDDKEKSIEAIGSNATFREILDISSHFLNSFSALFDGDFKNKFIGETFFSCEMAIIEKELRFYFVVPRNVKHLFEKQITAFYPDVFVNQVEDYNFFQKDSYISTVQYHLAKDSMFPIKTYKHLGSDPLNSIINAMSNIDDAEGIVIQTMLRPVSNDWQAAGRDYAQSSADGVVEKKSFLSYLNPFSLIKFIFTAIFSESVDLDTGGEVSRKTQLVEEQMKCMEEKSTHAGFESIIRVITSSPSKNKAEEHLSSVKTALAQYSGGDFNGFAPTAYHRNNTIIKNFILRSMGQDWWYDILHKKMILTSEELASIFHMPEIRLNKSPVIKWISFKIAPPPHNLPQEGLLLGTTDYRGVKKDVRILRGDRRRHFYLIGKSGTGKSTLLETTIKQDLANGEGLCVIDPHGDLVEAMLRYIPRERADDVIYFNPGDIDRPMGLNILEAYTDDQKEFMAQEALAIFIKMYGEEIMGPRLQNYFRNGCLTLMADDEDTATILDIPRLFTDDAFADYKQKKVTNVAVRQFWDKEMANTGQREKQEMIPYFSAKFGPFVTNKQIRNIIGQSKSGFDFRDVMDNKKILLVNLSKGQLGELNAKLLGMIIVAKIQMAAMSRVDTPEDERNDFYFYVDEFQNFVTDSFASILSEARKYRLNLIIAHQYISQITKLAGGGKGTQEDSTIRDAVFGNVGSMMCFKIGSADGETMSKEFAPVFTDQDLINIANYHAYIKLNVNNTTSRPFTLKTIYDPSGSDEEGAKAFMQLSRLKFARDKKFVDKEVERRLM